MVSEQGDSRYEREVVRGLLLDALHQAGTATVLARVALREADRAIRHRTRLCLAVALIGALIGFSIGHFA
jgi:hypothetical protein